jgi:Fic family protein
VSTEQPRHSNGQYGGIRHAEGTPDLGGHDASTADNWPAISYEEWPWAGAEGGGSRRQRIAARGPYAAAVVPSIAGLHAPNLGSDTRVLASEAAAEIARFDGELGRELAPFTSVLLRSESTASSKIENLTASAKAIGLAELGDRTRGDASMIVNNATAMRSAIELADHLDESAILGMHDALLGSDHPDWAGRWREDQVWIGGSNLSPHGAMFVPPHHTRVPAAMSDLVAFMARDDLEPLVQAAIAHAQFETIHPFPDGNGRVGRAVVHSLLRAKELTRNVTVPVSAGLLTDLDGYFAALDRYRAGDPQSIVDLMAEASFSAIDNGRHLVEDLRGTRAAWNEQIKARADAAAWRVAELLVQQPVVDSRSVATALGVPAMTADRAIETLVEAEVLAQVSGNTRNRRWAANDVLAALDAFAARGGRRARP